MNEDEYRKAIYDILQGFREEIYKAEKDHGKYTQTYDIAMSEAFRSAFEKLKSLEPPK